MSTRTPFPWERFIREEDRPECEVVLTTGKNKGKVHGSRAHYEVTELDDHVTNVCTNHLWWTFGMTHPTHLHTGKNVKIVIWLNGRVS